MRHDVLKNLPPFVLLKPGPRVLLSLQAPLACQSFTLSDFPLTIQPQTLRKAIKLGNFHIK